MKKIVSIILVLVMVVSASIINVAAEGWTLPLGATANPEIRFGLMADSHIKTDASVEEFTNAVSSFKNLDIDALALCGDIIYNAKGDVTVDAITPQYATLKKALKSSLSIDVNNTNSWNCITTPMETNLPSLKLTRGNHTIKIVGRTETSSFDSFTITAPTAYETVEGISAGTYIAEVNLDDYIKSTNGAKVEWADNALEPALYAAVYNDKDELVKAYKN